METVDQPHLRRGQYVEPQDKAVDDATLVRQVRHNPERFDILYRRYVAQVYRYCYARTSNRNDAEDLTAQTFLQAFESLHRYQERHSFTGWLFTIAHNTCAMFHRVNYSHPDTALEEESCAVLASSVLYNEGPERAVLQQELATCIRQALQTLSEEQCEAVHLRFWGGLTAREIAGVMERKTGAVKMLIWRAIERLRGRCVDEAEI